MIRASTCAQRCHFDGRLSPSGGHFTEWLADWEDRPARAPGACYSTTNQYLEINPSVHAVNIRPIHRKLCRKNPCLYGGKLENDPANSANPDPLVPTEIPEYFTAPHNSGYRFALIFLQNIAPGNKSELL